MTHGLGGDHNTAGLDLCDKSVNGRKIRLIHRYTAGVFMYMHQAVIWTKSRTSSQFMELALQECHTQYN
ncbi:hypothetical protein BDV12DRAFT_195255 [Aspergillus spectabilis]